VNSVTNPVTVGTNNDKSGYSLSTPQAFDLIGNISGTISRVIDVTNPVTAGNVTGSVLGNINGSVGSVIAPVTAGNVTGSVFGNVNGSVNSVIQPVGIATGTFINAMADQVWDEQLAGHLAAGSTGLALNGAGAAGDPWQTSLPGIYTEGQAGHILASRMPTGTVLIGDKTGFSLLSPQVVNIIGNISGTISTVLNVVNPVTAGNVTGSVLGNVEGSVNSVTTSVTVGNVTGSVFGNVNGSVASVTDLGSTLLNKIADFVLRRSFANARVSANGDAFTFRSLLGAIAKLVNRWNINAGVLSVYAEDDTTVVGTQNLTSDAAAEPITQIDTN
jgi:hypothetical protein